MLAPGFSNILGACLLKPFCPKLEISILISDFRIFVYYYLREFGVRSRQYSNSIDEDLLAN